MALKLEMPTSNEWFLLKGETQVGPYSYDDIIRMMQTSAIFGFDYVWSKHLDSWTTLAELPEFSPDRLARLLEKNPKSEVFHPRKGERLHCVVPIYAHNESQLWRGTVENLSEGGALIRMENPILLPGNVIQIHFRKLKEELKPFNCRAEITNKQFTKQRIQHNTALNYSCKFSEFEKDGEDLLKEWLTNLKKEHTK